MMTTRTGANFRIQVLRYERTGLPAEVIEAVALDLPAPGPGEALVALRCAAIHYSDLGLINGTYGKARSLPAVAGREAVGEVVALGPGVAAPKIGALVRMPEEAGVWREAVVAKAAELFPIPPGVPVEQAAMAFINPPTAWRLLRDFVQLERGDWLAQNAGTSAVGVLVAQLARHWGINASAWCVTPRRKKLCSRRARRRWSRKIRATKRTRRNGRAARRSSWRSMRWAAKAWGGCAARSRPAAWW